MHGFVWDVAVQLQPFALDVDDCPEDSVTSDVDVRHRPTAVIDPQTSCLIGEGAWGHDVAGPDVVSVNVASAR
jgi:hypothetical protein